MYEGANRGTFLPVFVNVQTGLPEVLLKTEHCRARKGLLPLSWHLGGHSWLLHPALSPRYKKDIGTPERE